MSTPSEHPSSSLLAAIAQVQQPRPKHVRPIMMIGAGGIVRSAHLPAYKKAGFPVIGIMDASSEKATELAFEQGIPHAFGSVAEALRFAPQDAVFDIAVPASQLLSILPVLPQGSVVLMQKPMGETIEEARAIRNLCRSKDLIAAVNFSLRYSPNNLAVQALASNGLLGEIHDIEVQTRTYTPWHLWTFLSTAPRLEILYHSIHYFDLIRSWLGNPHSVYARTVKHPLSANLAATRTTAILDYGDSKRVLVTANHGHNFGPAHQHSFVQWEGLAGAARISMGVNLDYPTGRPDTLEYAALGNTAPTWQSLPVSGNNFPDAFMGTMGGLQAFAEGSAATLPSHFEDAFQTMVLVEALYRSSERSGEPISYID
ncbi:MULTISPECIES: Gfo/Idh/MocA family protein [Acidobacteriaceae]|uniref:Gfo/Idh/MocA family protein n=1 Tax=Acidobacteriaceae TaxID=204434 RepID=UPI00131B2D2C|nr:MULTISPECIES: Gfo/Idh/MocA family oxidoreductase [Acidobacteriaceae]MDW5265179.1 Gfo/Idh/MocA family oxidoreductase [Edaphobacter sp.]